MNYLAQLFGIVAFIFFILSIQNRKKEKLLIFQLIANIFYGIQYILLNAVSTGIFNFISIIRSFIFYKYTKKGKKIPLLFLILFLIIISVVGIVKYSEPLCLIPLIITLLNTIYTYTNNDKATKYMFTICAIFWLYYNFKVQAYGALIGNIFELSSGVIAIIKSNKKRKLK